MQKAKVILLCGLGILIVFFVAIKFSIPLKGPYLPADCSAIEYLQQAE